MINLVENIEKKVSKLIILYQSLQKEKENDKKKLDEWGVNESKQYYYKHLFFAAYRENAREIWKCQISLSLSSWDRLEIRAAVKTT